MLTRRRPGGPEVSGVGGTSPARWSHSPEQGAVVGGRVGV